MKLSFFKRIFISISIISIVFINIALFFMYYLREKNYINTVKQNILLQADTIKTFLKINNNQFNLLPLQKLTKTNPGLFINIQKTNQIFPTRFILDNNILVYETTFHNYHIIVWKNLTELKQIKQSYIKSAFIISVVSLIIVLLVSFLLSKWLLKPINEILDFLNQYKLGKNTYLVNHYKWTDIGILIDKINNFIKKLNQAYLNQKQFMQDISHEIKTPLMQISTTIELIQDNMPEYKNQFQLIQDKIQFISDLVRKILFIEKLDENLKSEKINLNQYLKNLIQEYKNLAKSKDITINLIENAQLTINAPKYYLDRLFGNLLSNAIKYNKQNWKITLTINKDNIQIQDTWIWIDPQHMKNLFKRFYKGQNSTWTGLW